MSTLAFLQNKYQRRYGLHDWKRVREIVSELGGDCYRIFIAINAPSESVMVLFAVLFKDEV